MNGTFRVTNLVKLYLFKDKFPTFLIAELFQPLNLLYPYQL